MSVTKFGGDDKTNFVPRAAGSLPCRAREVFRLRQRTRCLSPFQAWSSSGTRERRCPTARLPRAPAPHPVPCYCERAPHKSHAANSPAARGHTEGNLRKRITPSVGDAEPADAHGNNENPDEEEASRLRHSGENAQFHALRCLSSAFRYARRASSISLVSVVCRGHAGARHRPDYDYADRVRLNFPGRRLPSRAGQTEWHKEIGESVAAPPDLAQISK